jgi:hypothetical protein
MGAFLPSRARNLCHFFDNTPVKAVAWQVQSRSIILAG